jgi:hypothetical protein
MPPRNPAPRNVRLGAPPKDDMETLPMPGFDAPDPKPAELVQPVLDPAAVADLAQEMAVAERAQAVQANQERAQEPQGAQQPQLAAWTVPAPQDASQAPAADDLRAKLDDLSRRLQSSDTLLADLTEKAASQEFMTDSIRKEFLSRIEALVAGLDPALAARTAPLREQIEGLSEAIRLVDKAHQISVRRIGDLEKRNPDHAEFNGRVRDLSDRVEEMRRSLRDAVRGWWDEWRREAAHYAAPLIETRPEPAPRTAVRTAETPIVKFEVLGKGLQFHPRQNPDGSIGLILNLTVAHAMGEISIPRTGEGVREVDFLYAVHVPSGWLADVTCAPQQPDKPLPQQRAYITTLHGSTPPGQTLTLNLHCSTGARGVQSGTEVARLHLRRVEPAVFEVSDGLQSPMRAAERERESLGKDAEIERLRKLLASQGLDPSTGQPRPLTGRYAETAEEAAAYPQRVRYGSLGVDAPGDPWSRT